MAQPIAASTIAQQACRFMEKRPIGSFAEDHELPQAMAEQYPTALRMCLEAHDWGFARKLALLPEIAALPAGEIADDDLPHVYALPSDCAALRLVLPAGTRYRRDEALLRADVGGGLKVRYTRVIDNEALLPATFRTYVALQLAVLLAPEYVTTRTKRADLKDDLASAEAAAKRAHFQDASAARMDGRDEAGDWAEEATA